MQIATRTTDRTALIAFLKEETGERPKYMGAPTFQYVIGPYTVLRNADIETNDAAGAKLLDELKKNGFTDDGPEKGISIPFETETVRARINLLNMIYARQDIINKAVGKDHALFVTKWFLKRIHDKNPQTLQEFREALLYYHADRCVKGIKFYDDRVIFTGFPLDGTKYENAAMNDLATAMVRKAERQRWVKPEVEHQENEKYSFRGWLLSLGLSGKEHQKTRSVLLRRLDGIAAYRTEEQKDKAMMKRRKQREQEAQEENKHDDFTIL